MNLTKLFHADAARIRLLSSALSYFSSKAPGKAFSV
jgi:hypothetical protein